MVNGTDTYKQVLGRSGVMKRKWIWILGCIILILIYAGWRFWIGAPGDRYALAHEINHMIRTHDLVEINKISYNQDTRLFLSKLPIDAEVNKSKTQSDLDYDNVGSHITIYHYETVLDEHSVDVYMKSNTPGLHFFFPQWTVTRISVNGLPPLSRSFMD